MVPHGVVTPNWHRGGWRGLDGLGRRSMPYLGCPHWVRGGLRCGAHGGIGEAGAFFITLVLILKTSIIIPSFKRLCPRECHEIIQISRMCLANYGLFSQ